MPRHTIKKYLKHRTKNELLALTLTKLAFWNSQKRYRPIKNFSFQQNYWKIISLVKIYSTIYTRRDKKLTLNGICCKYSKTGHRQNLTRTHLFDPWEFGFQNLWSLKFMGGIDFVDACWILKMLLFCKS